MKRLLLALIFGLLPVSVACGEVEWPVIETGKAGMYWSFALRTNPEPVPPGGIIANEARWSEPPLSGTAVWYFAGVDVRTAHIFIIFQEYSKAASRVVETERRPILLTLDQDDSALLTLLPIHAKPVTLLLKWNPDQSLSVSVQPNK